MVEGKDRGSLGAALEKTIERPSIAHSFAHFGEKLEGYRVDPSGLPELAPHPFEILDLAKAYLYLDKEKAQMKESLVEIIVNSDNDFDTNQFLTDSAKINLKIINRYKQKMEEIDEAYDFSRAAYFEDKRSLDLEKDYNKMLALREYMCSFINRAEILYERLNSEQLQNDKFRDGYLNRKERKREKELKRHEKSLEDALNEKEENLKMVDEDFKIKNKRVRYFFETVGVLATTIGSGYIASNLLNNIDVADEKYFLIVEIIAGVTAGAAALSKMMSFYERKKLDKKREVKKNYKIDEFEENNHHLTLLKEINADTKDLLDDVKDKHKEQNYKAMSEEMDKILIETRRYYPNAIS